MNNIMGLEKITSFVCVDLETTGLDPRSDKIIEIGALKVKDKKIVGRFSELINPHIELTPRISQLTGITNEMLQKAEDEEKVLDSFLEFAGEEVLIGHNLIFDFSFLKTAVGNMNHSFERKGIDTLELSKKFLPNQKSKSLTNLCQYYNINNDHAHRAFDDAKATTHLYVKLCNLFFDQQPDSFQPKPLFYKIKKVQPITNHQKNYLIQLLKYHNIKEIQSIENLTKSDASKLIDKIIFENGRMNF